MTSSLPFFVIAIDGGAATGKSTASQTLSERFHLLHVNTGSHYRTLTRMLLDHPVGWQDERAVQNALEQLPIETRLDGKAAILQLRGKPYSQADLRTEEVNQTVSYYAKLTAVRNALKEYQRSLVGYAKEHGFHGVVMEGRDIGSVILPDADFRFFLQADQSVREERRRKEGQNDSIEQRDRLDSNRTVAPLEIPQGAIVIDTGALTREQVVETIAQHVLSAL